ncbi:MAG TPA: FUSC family protein [Longimicrobiaceae bacterium]|nr:FUSC family protein [Longimicrobiaceae bacterium]
MSTHPIARQLRDLVRFAPGRPAVANGLRAAVATVAPLLLGEALDQPAVMWSALIGFSVVLADKGGAYRTRAATMGALTIAGLVAVVLGALAGAHLWLSVATMFAVGGLLSLARAYGAQGMPVAVSGSVVLVISLAYPAAGLADVLTRAVFLLGGAAWAMLLTLVLWPVRVYRPARRDVARCYRALADHADAVAALAARGAEETGAPVGDPAALRSAIETARATLAFLRRGRPGESPRGERLLMLLEHAEAAFGELVALADLASAGGGRGPLPRVGAEIAELSRSMRGIAEAIERERGRPTIAVPPPPDESPTAGPVLAAGLPEAERAHARRLLARLRDAVLPAAEAAEELNSDRPTPVPGVYGLRHPRPVLAPLREALSGDSLVLRHALRIGLTTAVAIAITKGLGLVHGYWVTLTVLVILQPYPGATFVKGMQRVLGTVLGAILAALFASALPDPRALIALIFVLAVVCVALLPLNYGLYAVFLTPTFVLLAEVTESDWSLAHVRVVNTLIGGAIAFAGATLLWVTPERKRFPGHLASAIEAARRYVGAAFGCLVEECGPTGLAALRRRMGLELINADASLQRWLTESRVQPDVAERAMAAVSYLHRLGAAATSLAARPPIEPSPLRDSVPAYAHAIDAALGAAAATIERGGAGAPAELPRPVSADPLLERQLVRIGLLTRRIGSTAEVLNAGLRGAAYGVPAEDAGSGHVEARPRLPGRLKNR